MDLNLNTAVENLIGGSLLSGSLLGIGLIVWKAVAQTKAAVGKADLGTAIDSHMFHRLQDVDKENKHLNIVINTQAIEIGDIKAKHAHEIGELKEAHAREIGELRTTLKSQAAQILLFREELKDYKEAKQRLTQILDAFTKLQQENVKLVNQVNLAQKMYETRREGRPYLPGEKP